MTHELGIVQNLVNGLLAQLDQQGIREVNRICLRRGSAFSEDALRQAYSVMIPGTPLEGANLEIQTVNLDLTCCCGHRQMVTSDELIGHLFICPRCGAVREIEEAHDLELVEMTAADDTHDGC